VTPNRIVAVLTPLVFAPAAGAIAAWAATHAPGVTISQQDLTSVFIAGALIALAPAAQWLHGWQKYEDRQAQSDNAVELATAAAAAGAIALPADIAAEPEDEDAEGPALDELDELDALDALAEGDEDDEEDPLIAGLPVGAGAGD
jgi:hypothetical protein